MNADRWKKIDEIFQAALECDSGARDDFVAAACTDDDELRQEVESMLEHHSQASTFIETPAYVDAAKTIANADVDADLSGRSFGRFEILRPLGTGGMGVVYLAFDPQLQRQVALKFLQNYLLNDEERVQRFVREARAASALNHPNILTVYEIGEVDSERFIATEFIGGKTLREEISTKVVNMIEALEIAIQVASALSTAHSAGITHRDIKPENIMLRPDGYVKVLDFGLAKLTDREIFDASPEATTEVASNTGAGTVIGTLKYMSPEQAQGLTVDSRTDLWSLGAVLYEMIAGCTPFEGETPSHIKVSILDKKPTPLIRISPQTPRELDWIVSKALRKDKTERYQTAHDLLTDLRYLLQQIELDAELQRYAEPNITGLIERPEVARSGPPLAMGSVGSKDRFTSSGRRPRRLPDSLAVLPLSNVRGDEHADYLCDGITESIINSLSRLPKLRVVPRSTVFRYKGKEIDPQQVGHDLNVRAVLVGRLLHLDDRLVIKTELIDVLNDSQLWGEQYNRKLSDILELEEEISKEISETLRIKLTGEDRKRLTKRHTKNTDAYQAYLKGRYYWNKRTPESLQKAIEYFEQATRADSKYARAYSGLADSYTLLNYYGIFPSETTRPKATIAAKKGLDADEGLAETHASAALVAFWYDWDWLRAHVEFEQSVKLNPGYAAAHQWYCWYLAAMRKYDRAAEEAQLALDLDPLAPTINLALAKFYFLAHRYDDTIQQCRRTLELDNNFIAAHYFLGQACVQKGMFDEAVEMYKKGLQALGGLPLGRSIIAHARALAGDRRSAEQTLSDLIKESKSNREYVPAYGIALIHIGLGNKTEAIDWLQKAYDERFVWLVYLNVDPVFDSLRNEAEFENLIRRMQFP